MGGRISYHWAGLVDRGGDLVLPHSAVFIMLRTRWVVLIGLTSVALKSVMVYFGLLTYFFFQLNYASS